jgi:hypothetical protein
MVGIKVRGGPAVGFGKRVLTREQITPLLLLHFDYGPFELRQEILDLRRLRCPFLFAHPFVQDDLLVRL